MTMPNKKGSAGLTGIFLALLFVAGFLAFYVSGGKFRMKSNDPNSLDVWKTYTSPDKTFSFLYPPSAGLIRNNEEVTVVIPGNQPTNKTTSRSVINLVLGSRGLGSGSVQNYTQEKLNERRQRGDFIDQEIADTDINGLKGYTFTALDTAFYGSPRQYIYLELPAKKRLIYIISLVVDNDHAGYRDLVNKILSTLKVP